MAGSVGVLLSRRSLYETAERAGRVAQDVPTKHSPSSAPVIHPTLETGVQAMVTAAVDALTG